MAGKYQNLVAWQRSMQLVLAVYEATQAFPPGERYGLRAQLRRAAISVPSNIAEGDGRRGNQDQRRFFLNARGSLMEIETQVLIAHRLDYLSDLRSSTLLDLIDSTARPLNGLISKLE